MPPPAPSGSDGSATAAVSGAGWLAGGGGATLRSSCAGAREPKESHGDLDTVEL